MPQATPDLAGQRFGRLAAVERSPKKGHAYWVCLCDCGSTVAVTSTNLRKGHTQSCGCLRRDVTTARSTRHGLMTRAGRTPTYYSWSNMIRRVTNPDHPRYADWGGRGITVCDRWRDYPNFLADMGEKPPGTTLDRINNDGNYEPGNCRWATSFEQQANRRSTKLTPKKVREIRRLYERGFGTKDIAAAVKIDRHTVGTVCTVIRVLT